MTYQAFYRVYRPQTFREMSGQIHVKRTLQNALLGNKTTHAYLFSGPRGTGKTSTAKIFAKALNCESAPASEPCNECATCKSITEGSHTDVIEFDAASNSRVEEMRDIIEKVRFAPADARFKVYIIDEVHMLSTSAFNALLKTLEEPPEHAVFILATTEPHKLPATIISRCQRFDFKRLSSIDIVERMKIVLEDIQMTYDDQALKVIAQAAAGGMRDALSLLDQVVSFSSESIQLEDVLLVTGSVSQDAFYDIACLLKEKDVARVLSIVENLIADGKEPLRLAEDFITFFRDLLLMQMDGMLEELLAFISPEQRFVELANNFDANSLYGFIDILAKTQQEMRFSHHTKIYLETALLKMAQLKADTHTTVGLDPALAGKVTSLENMLGQLTQQLQSGGTPSTQVKEQARQRVRPAGNQYNPPSGRIKEVLKSATKTDIQKIKAAWAISLAQMQKSQAALLADAEPVAANSDAFVLKFKYDIHCQMVADNKGLISLFTQGIAVETGIQYEVLCIPDQAWGKLRENFIKENGLDQKKPEVDLNQADEQHDLLTEKTFIEEAQQMEVQDPLVTEAEQRFGKDFVDVVEE